LVLIIGLGNPGAAYENNRHNIGFMVIARLAAAHAIKCSSMGGGPGGSYLWSGVGRRSWRNWWAGGERWTIEGVDVVLAKPLTFMNRSGAAVSELVSFLGITPSSLIVVCDDCDLPLGRIRIRNKGGSGGHKGLSSIITHLGSSDFPRVRMGVGRPPGGEESLSDYVLSPFSPDQKEGLESMLKTGVASIETILGKGIEYAMNFFN
jgi:PTH1 family peptidyl-tRNA hydrolase